MKLELHRPDTDAPDGVTVETLQPVGVRATTGSPGDFDATPTAPDDAHRTGDRWAVFGAAVATLAVAGSLLVFLVRSDSGAAGAPDLEATVTTLETGVSESEVSMPSVEPVTSVPGFAPVPTVPDIGVVPVPSVPTPQAPQAPTVVSPAPPSGQTSPPPPPPASVPTPDLHVQPIYELDPGVHGLTISVANTGDAALTFELANAGEGYTTEVPVGDVEPGASVDVWLDLDVAADGEGPTPFERTVEVTSSGGDATISIVGQVEKPGYLVPDHASLPLVDYRAAVSFTNVGGLPVTITQLDAPGFTYGPLPDAVEAGESFTIEVAICATDADLLPVFANVPIPGLPFPGFLYGGEVTVGTIEGTATTELEATSPVFAPPSCEPVVVAPTADFALGS